MVSSSSDRLGAGFGDVARVTGHEVGLRMTRGNVGEKPGPASVQMICMKNDGQISLVGKLYRASQFWHHAIRHRGRDIREGHESIRVSCDEAGRQVVACCPVGVEDLKETRHVNPGLIHGMQHQGRVVFHPDFILPPDVAVEVNDLGSVNHRFPLFVKYVPGFRHR